MVSDRILKRNFRLLHITVYVARGHFNVKRDVRGPLLIRSKSNVMTPTSCSYSICGPRGAGGTGELAVLSRCAALRPWSVADQLGRYRGHSSHSPAGPAGRRTSRLSTGRYILLCRTESLKLLVFQFQKHDQKKRSWFILLLELKSFAEVLFSPEKWHGKQICSMWPLVSTAE